MGKMELKPIQRLTGKDYKDYETGNSPFGVEI
jgi:hypothetical protein